MRTVIKCLQVGRGGKEGKSPEYQDYKLSLSDRKRLMCHTGSTREISA